MKEYTALHFVKIGKALKTPGEIFRADLPADVEARLLRKGAIIAQQQAAAPAIERTEKVQTVKAAKAEAEAVTAEEVITDDVAPEIDVMAGIGTPKKTTRRKSK